DEMFITISIDGRIRQLGSSKTAHSVAAQVMHPEFEVLLGYEPAGVRAESSACRVGVKRAGSGCRSGASVGIDAIAEDTGYTEDLVMSEARFERQLGNEIG